MLNFFIDRGGTFTDFYVQVSIPQQNKSYIETFKVLSEGYQQRDGPSQGINQMFNNLNQKYPQQKFLIRSIIMGTTIVTNALLERKGNKTALIITQGFRDLIQIGNQSRPNIFDLKMKKYEVLYSCVVEINERVGLIMDHYQTQNINEKIQVLKQIDEQEVKLKLIKLKQEGYDSIAVCFIHSSVYQKHELVVKQIAKEIGFRNISLSSEVSKTVKCVPRGQTAVIDAYVNILIQKYQENFINEIKYLEGNPRVMFMMSDGGLSHSNSFFGCKALLSGPAGGIVGMIKTTKNILKQTGKIGVIGFDMGGTSTDVSVFYGGIELRQELVINGIEVSSPCFDINTVAAGGGSRINFEQDQLKIGPQSSGAVPGPVCYGRGGYLSVTDANLILGKIEAKYFPKIFGINGDEEISYEKSLQEFSKLSESINKKSGLKYTPYQVAEGAIKVANESMCRPIRQMTQGRGKNTQDHILFVFGSAGGQHCTGMADELQIDTIFVHKYASILSAYGLSCAKEQKTRQNVFQYPLNEKTIQIALIQVQQLIQENEQELLLSDQTYIFQHNSFIDLRFAGSDYYISVEIEYPNYQLLINQFLELHKQQFGFTIAKPIQCGYIRVISNASYEQENNKEEIEKYLDINDSQIQQANGNLLFNEMEQLKIFSGPTKVFSNNTTVVVEKGWTVQKTSLGNLILFKQKQQQQQQFQTLNEINYKCDPILLSVFGNRFMSIAEQMGKALQQTAISTNIKERLDYSCAIFRSDGSLIANAPHLPVHLGSMSDAVKYQLSDDWKDGEVILSNHPVAGGSHLPDMTVMSPCFHNGKPIFYVASRGHHADIGGITPGSMPAFSKSLSEEGVAIKHFKIVRNGVFQNEDLENLLLNPKQGKGTRNIQDNLCDLLAQVSACNIGIKMIQDLIAEQGLDKVLIYMKFIQQNAEESVRRMLVQISLKNQFKAIQTIIETEYMDDGTPIKLALTIDRIQRNVIFDFSGTGSQVKGNINCPPSVTRSAVLYCLRCLIDEEIPLNQGCLEPTTIIVPENSLLKPSEDAAIVGGNVLTSQRITDIILKCFRATAGSQGCMNNFTFGEINKEYSQFSYYETIAGGGGAGIDFNGESGVQVHMTNTRITDIEIIERRYPVRINKFTLRLGSGGKGKYNGGDGVIREFQFLCPLSVSLLTERRVYSPFGMQGGQNGQKGINTLINTNGQEIDIGGKNNFTVQIGEIIRIETPGGGGFGQL